MSSLRCSKNVLYHVVYSQRRIALALLVDVRQFGHQPASMPHAEALAAVDVQTGRW